MIDYAMLLHNDCLAEFSHQRYKDVIDLGHLSDEGIVNYPKGRYTSGDEVEINFWGWVATRDGINWLIPLHSAEGSERVVKDILPLVPTKWDTVSFKNKSFRLITDYTSVSFRREKRMSMRDLVNRLSSIPHSNPKHRKLLLMAVLSQVCSRAYFRFSSPPSTGKDSTIDLFGALVGDCITLENPSIAKLELHAATKRVTGLNEVVGLSRSQWEDVGKFMLASCAFKSKISKRTLSHGVVGNEIDLRGYSISVFYNDIDCYPDKKVLYFDGLAEEGIRDRLPALRLFGGFEYDFNSVERIDVPSFVREHWDEYMNIIYTLLYFRDNFPSCKYSYSFSSVPARWKRSLGVLQCVVSEYSESEAEFLSWMKVIESCIVDYRAMLEYPELLEQARLKKGFEVLEKFIKKENSFSGKITLLLDFLTDKKVKDPSNANLVKPW